MELVYFAHVKLSRYGTSVTGDFQSRVRSEIEKQKYFMHEIPGPSIDHLKEAVAVIDNKNDGYTESSWLVLDDSLDIDAPKGQYAFRRGAPGDETLAYNRRAYAICEIIPALQAGGRYFKLEEMSVN